MTAKITVGKTFSLPREFKVISQEGYKVLLAKGSLPQTLLRDSPTGTFAHIVYEKNAVLFDYPSDGNVEPITELLLKDPMLTMFGTTLEFANLLAPNFHHLASRGRR